jgi:hypothetical protein
VFSPQVAYFSGLLKKKSMSERVLARVTIEAGTQSVTLSLHCDDALLSATLLDVFKRVLASPHSPRPLDRSGGGAAGPTLL